MSQPRLLLLGSIAVILLIPLVVLYWPVQEQVPGTPLDAERIRALPQDEAVGRVALRLTQRAGSALSGWQRLPTEARTVYAVRAFTAACSTYGLADQALACAAFPEAPDWSACAAACTEIGASEIAALLDEAVALAARSEAELTAWSAYRSGAEGGPPTDPFAALDARLRPAMGRTDFDSLLRRYILDHADQLADP